MTRLELIAYNFKRLRHERGWTQAETAQKGGVRTDYVGQIESCKVQSFGASAEEKWSRVFSIGIDEFFRKPYAVDLHSEFVLLREQAAKYGPDKIRKLRTLIPILLGEENVDAVDTIPEEGGAEGKRKAKRKKAS